MLNLNLFWHSLPAITATMSHTAAHPRLGGVGAQCLRPGLGWFGLGWFGLVWFGLGAQALRPYNQNFSL